MLAGLPSPPLFEAKADASWKNNLIWGENKYVIASLLHGDPSIGLEPLAGKIDLIYIDPPFATGEDFSINIRGGPRMDEGSLFRGSLLFSQLKRFLFYLMVPRPVFRHESGHYGRNIARLGV